MPVETPLKPKIKAQDITNIPTKTMGPKDTLHAVLLWDEVLSTILYMVKMKKGAAAEAAIYSEESGDEVFDSKRMPPILAGHTPCMEQH